MRTSSRCDERSGALDLVHQLDDRGVDRRRRRPCAAASRPTAPLRKSISVELAAADALQRRPGIRHRPSAAHQPRERCADASGSARPTQPEHAPERPAAPPNRTPEAPRDAHGLAHARGHDPPQMPVAR